MINGITIFKVVGLTKKPKKVKLLNIKSKNELILFFKSSGNGGILIQPNNNSTSINNKSHKKFNKFVNISLKKFPICAKKSAITKHPQNRIISKYY